MKTMPQHDPPETGGTPSTPPVPPTAGTLRTRAAPRTDLPVAGGASCPGSPGSRGSHESPASPARGTTVTDSTESGGQPSGPEKRFRELFDAAYLDVLRFVQRRLGPDLVSASADDVVSDAFLVAWRRADSIPAEAEEARAWLFGIARNCLLNQGRSHRRQDTLGVRLADTTRHTPDSADLAVTRADLARAWGRLTSGEQEVLAMAVLDGLTSVQAGATLGISAGAYRLRLSRARAALRAHLGDTPAASRPDNSDNTQEVSR